MASIMLLAIPEIFTTEQHDLWYYVAGVVLFLLLGLIVGYFIWRRSHLQFAEIRHEKTNAIAALKKFSEELEGEQKMIDDSAHEDAAVVSARRKRKSKKPLNKPVLAPVSDKETPSQDSTMAIEPPENPVAKAMRKDSAGKPISSSGPSEGDDEL